MRKRRIAAAWITVLLSMAAVFTLGACFDIQGEVEEKYEAEGRAQVIELFNAYFEDTLADTNQVVTTKVDGTVTSVETIEGTSDYVSYQTGTKTYSFVKDGEYYYATDAAGTKSLERGITSYNSGYFVYKATVESFIRDVSESEKDATYFGTVTITTPITKEGEDPADSNGTMDLEITFNGTTITVRATSVNDKVTSYTYTVVSQSGTQTTQITFTYGNASVTLPEDATEWGASGQEE